jgi:predicted nicotinamide N-methyase
VFALPSQLWATIGQTVEADITMARYFEATRPLICLPDRPPGYSRPMASRRSGSRRGFVLRHTRLRPVPGLEDVRLHLADEVLPLWRDVQLESGDPDSPLPYWAFAWAGGLAIARYLRDRREVVAGRRVFDLASGSGLCAIAAKHAGAVAVSAADIDPFAAAAIELNARANAKRIAIVGRDVLDDPPPAVDVILAGDCWYEASLAERVLPWLRAARQRGIDVVVGDPGRRYLPIRELVELASYDVRTTTELEDLELKRGRVYAFRRGTS